MDPLHLLIVCDAFPPKCGGAGWSTYYLCKGLVSRGHKITVIKLDVLGEGEQQTTYDGITVHIAAGRSGKGLTRLEKERAEKILRKKITSVIASCKATQTPIGLIHPQYLRSAIASPGHDIPYVVTVRDYWPLCYKGTLYRTYSQTRCPSQRWIDCTRCVVKENPLPIKIASPLVTPYLRNRTWRGMKAVKGADHVIMVSDHVMDLFEGIVPSDKMTKIYNITSDKDLSKTKAKLFDKKTVIFVGKLNQLKGAMMFAKGAVALKHIDPDLCSQTRFLIFGSGELKKQMKDLLTSEGIDHMFTSVPNAELMPYLKGADVVVNASLWDEPFGRTIMEPLSVGAALIGTKRGGIVEGIDAGRNGLVIDPDDEDDGATKLAAAIKNLIDHPKQAARYRKEAVSFQTGAFATKNILDAHEQVYHLVVQKKE